MQLYFLKRVFNFVKRKMVAFYQCDLNVSDILGKINGRFHKKILLDLKIANYSSERRYDATSEYNRKYNSYGKRYRVIFKNKIAVRDIILAQIANYNNLDFRFADMAARWCAIEDYLQGKEDGMNMYAKMQNDLGSDFDWGERFKKMIDSCETQGFDSDKKIQLDKKLAVLDGSHRLSYAFYKGIDIVSADIYKRVSPREVNQLWFWENDYPDKYCERIQYTIKTMLDKAKYNYWGIIWPSALSVADELITDIERLYGDERVKVVQVREIQMSYREFVYFFKAVYRYDCMSEAGMMPKINLILHSSKYRDGDPISMKAFCLAIDSPEICLNEKNGMPKSMAVTRIKKALRGRYKEKVYDYAYDTIIHITDNYIQSRALEILLDLDTDLTDLFVELRDYKYAVLKKNSLHQHENFPNAFLWGKDTDILTSESYFEQIIHTIKMFCENKYGKYKEVSVDCSLENDHYHIDVKLFERLLISFDLVKKLASLKSDFLVTSLDNAKLDNGCKVLQINAECMIRLYELYTNPKKDWHREFLKEKQGFWRISDIEKSFERSSVGKITAIASGIRKE